MKDNNVFGIRKNSKTPKATGNIFFQIDQISCNTDEDGKEQKAALVSVKLKDSKTGNIFPVSEPIALIEGGILNVNNLVVSIF